MSEKAEELKELGNKAFGSKDFDAAIKHYSSAIQLDKKNHVYFSNRSACYAGLQQHEKASTDAKECIRLDPTFVKGYYRLVTSQIALKQYDAALSAIQQGLAVDANNTQLMKQQRMVQQLKRSHEANLKKKRQQTESAASSSGMPMAGAASSEIQELYTQFTQNKREYETEKVNFQKLEREQKISELTKADLEPLPPDQKCFKSVGKMFLMSKKKEIMEYLDTNITTAQNKQQETNKKMDYLEKKIQSQQQNMEELQKQAIAAE
mmetsp:Transcript_12236/g.16001  ORF Transcript_12236/g.16001 Transcript_12236/m.16001 type:complete len:264 (+) Transcript_12236:116-907(+)|eukprot:CAMPEP_0198149444 /NCGR_PEP_ID=MMETSP1443-20131203/46589_1 /TAXON_ID=186043 /ORGANISM="Entomoneis sp., Strain CCMP2396" /LENGTH=263 /DNA_ID=CAMNT_0043814475 /DNA_START=75 /DNA_END=866 /DNA_ORIENTATION=+